MSAAEHRSRPALSSVILIFAAFALAWPPTGVWAVLIGDPDRWRYGAVWYMTMASPFVALGVVRWFTRKRVPPSWTESVTRAALLLAVSLAAGLLALRGGWPDVLHAPIAPFAVALAVLIGWVVVWKLADARRALRAPAPPIPAAVRPAGAAPAKPKKPKRPSGPKPGSIWWAYVPTDVRKVEQHRPCVVVRNHQQHAWVAPISHHRSPGDLRLDPGGWSSEDRPSYVRPAPLVKVMHGRFDQRMGQCPPDVWNRLIGGPPPMPQPQSQPQPKPQRPASDGVPKLR